MTDSSIKIYKYQFWVLILISGFFLWTAPVIWRYSPDGGVYIGTALSLVETGQYSFNGHPNLLYYPGFSILLAALVSLFGVNFQVLHLFTAMMAVLSLWLVRAYFPVSRYGLAGALAPVLLACTAIFQEQAFRILSDATFLATVLGALLLWRVYEEKTNRWALAACFLLVCYAPLVRLEGVFLCAGFGGALLLKAVTGNAHKMRNTAIAIMAGLSTVIPFALWTWRNYHLYTPDTFNMANKFFFGLKGLVIRLPGYGYGRVDWIDAEWKYGFYNALHLVQAYVKGIFGEIVTRALSLEAVFVLFVGIVLIGSMRWFKNATRMEQIFIGLATLFVMYRSLTSHSLYVVPRYLLALSPFILVSAGLGVTLVTKLLARTPLQHAMGAVIMVTVVLILSRGVENASAEVNPNRSAYYENANQVLENLVSYVGKNVPQNVTIATTDWGILPFKLKRESYQILNDKDDKTHLLTLERMVKYRTQYLVILEPSSISAPAAQTMVDDLPSLFKPVYETKPQGPGPTGAIYAFDIEGAKSVLGAHSIPD